MTITREARIDRRGKLAKTLITGFFASLMLATSAMPAMAATPPTFPNNIVIFPERDFVSLEGYEGKIGQTATITVLRKGEISGKATGTVGAGDPSLEVNHPGGVCWNEEIAPGIKVTPNIKPGDTVRVQFRDGTTLTGSDSARTQNARVTGFRKVGDNQLVVNGRVAAGVNKSFMEQRVINPDLDDTDVGRRDIRAPGRPGPYNSTLNFPTATSFRATYTFNTSADTTAAEATQMRDIAAEGQMRVLAWMGETADGDRQGLTIYEFGEVGGPGMGGCPAGPENTAPLAASNVTANAGDASISVNWNAASIIPDGSPVTGYRVTATSPDGVETSVNVANVNATSATVTGLQNGTAYTVDVRATSAAGLGRPGSASGTFTPQSVVAVRPNAPTIGAASDGAAGDPISATAAWTESTQPAGVVIDGYRVTAFNVNADGTQGSRIKSVFVNAPAAQSEVPFASAPAGQVAFKVQAIDGDGTLSRQSALSNSVTAQ